MGGQIRAGFGAVFGFDIIAALAMGEVLGIDALVVVELLPAIEAQMVNQTNSREAE